MPIVAYYPFDDDTVKDRSGANNDGTPTDITFGAGQFGQAASFNGATSRIATGITNLGTGNDPYSVLAWMKSDFQPATGADRIITKSLTVGVGDSEFALQQDGTNDGVIFSVTNTANTRFLAAGDITSNVWTHVGCVFTGSQIILYLNGELAQTINITGTLRRVATPIYLGCRGDFQASTFYKGLMDEVRIYNEELSEDQVKLLFHHNYLRVLALSI